MFDGYKWDLQAGEQSTISNQIVILGEDTLHELSDSAVSLYHETIEMEKALKNNFDLVLEIGISEKMAKALCDCTYNPNEHIRLMRFDFHPTTTGWQISEVNSDVPAGYPESSILPRLAQKYFNNYIQCGDFGSTLANEITKLVPAKSTIAYLHDTHTVEDYQIMHFMGDLLEQQGFHSLYIDPSHIKWDENAKALNVDAIIRYFPVEWLEYKKNMNWLNFINTKTPSCNHPIALLTQSKRLPLVWNQLGVDIPYWKKLLPKTANPLASSNQCQKQGWILKPAFGRVGEGINIPNTLSKSENQKIQKTAGEYPLQWVSQKMFDSVPIEGLHLNLGVFVINGQFAGMYARASKLPKIDSTAIEMPVLYERTV